ncbi:MAG: formate dehydrogenase accessory sulfurtransferase FdhD [Planctomycetota bacterium]|nr:formate dehydrogenase accessory sulfurtransferase FdhD [Planctomycetota bacterium]
MEPTIRQRCFVVESGLIRPADRDLLGEEPLTIRVGQTPVATLMRTPGHEVELALGHLVTEGLIAGAGEVGAIGFCPDGGVEPNVVQVTLAQPSSAPLLPPHRRVFSSCALCGAEQIEQAARDLRAFAPRPRSLSPASLSALAEGMGRGQVLFPATGASHAAAIAMRPLDDAALGAMIVREDIGRHNALDKAVGAALGDGLDLRQAVLCLSSRLSFEMVAKAARAGIADVIGLSAPTALAVALARRLGMFLAGFVRGATFTVYSGDDVLSR